MQIRCKTRRHADGERKEQERHCSQSYILVHFLSCIYFLFSFLYVLIFYFLLLYIKFIVLRISGIAKLSNLAPRSSTVKHECDLGMSLETVIYIYTPSM